MSCDLAGGRPGRPGDDSIIWTLRPSPILLSSIMRAFITGITGQDADHYLAELLLEKGL